MSDITRDDVAHLARLARLAVTDEELDTFSRQIDAIVDTVSAVGDIPDDVPPTAQVVPQTNVLRADATEPSLPRDVALAGAPAAEEGRFRVPRILGEEL
ncbi:Asp-tRNA(Asn)/Glu-tRNA(Gln) amidotransferase subunit GatC [Actinomycetospora cinnamomea]|uniref:Aspartyl/glutamyl-tRNA(Asn/Gln) amidotransferase subunit C n=1 Tax=Actinomycetospora cinnamomea TaxID=663609 RepID=A0A2U1FR74_9PSEU|nr:Asp-tRNA(Asn)/Glu-tRNA(Gln) amidotransferase subunit GatC [Actinomycetospora cinnamomea]PVZ14622.1 aspartyl/glutamyl-tRNA(Asn/Gln) amidotransferase subunit C [Actinomycetospora cinnamomea]